MHNLLVIMKSIKKQIYKNVHVWIKIYSQTTGECVWNRVIYELEEKIIDLVRNQVRYPIWDQVCEYIHT